MTGLAGAAGFAVVLAMIAGRIPVATAMGVVGMAGFLLLEGWQGAAFVLGAAPFEAIFPYTLSVIPLFIIMGIFAAHAGLSRALFDAAAAFVGHWRGGLALATIAACAAFGAICGSSLATVATIGRVALPEMRRWGYQDTLAAATVAAGGTLGILIPPSIILVIYGILTETSIGALLVAGVVPGLLGALLYGLAIVIVTRLQPEAGPALARASWRAWARSLGRVWQVLGLFLLVIGGIYWGWFSPTEAAAIGAIGAVLVAALRRQLGHAVLKSAVLEIAGTTGMIFFILIGANLFGYFLEIAGVPEALTSLIRYLDFGPTATLIGILLFYIVLGCFMDSLSMVLLTVPFLAPVAADLGLDLVWFGILVVTVVEIGLITPPVGMNLFVVQATAGIEQRTVVAGILPFILADLVRLALLVLLPSLALYLPSRLGM